MISANQNPGVVGANLAKEIVAGRIVGPFSNPPFLNFRVSPLGVVPKKIPGEFRLIHHSSFPRGASINDGISPEYTTVSYSRVDDAITIIKKLGGGCFLAKADIKSAFRIIPIRPAVSCGRESIIMIEPCPWGVHLPAAHSKCLAVLLSGLLKLGVTFHILFISLMTT